MSTQSYKLINRPNPLLSVVITPVERELLKKYARDNGVSLAQMIRGLIRVGLMDLGRIDRREKVLRKAIREGVI